jgi:hypothetical protein
MTMNKVWMTASALTLLMTACAPQTPVTPLPAADVAAVRFNSANSLDVNEGPRSMKVNVSLDAAAPPSFGLRAITQPTDYLVTHVSSIVLQLYSCTSAANAEAANPAASCTPVGTPVVRGSLSLNDTGNSISFNINKLGASKFYTVQAIARNASNTQISTSAAGDGFPAIHPTTTKREYISTTTNGTISLTNDATVSGNADNVTISATANTQIDIKLKLNNSTGGSVTSNGVEVENGAVVSTGEEIV